VNLYTVNDVRNSWFAGAVFATGVILAAVAFSAPGPVAIVACVLGADLALLALLWRPTPWPR
jgi:hypothetical protein